MKEATDKIKGLIEIQKQNGNYNYDEFMYGMLIGMEAVYYSLLEEEAQYTEKPEKWLSNKAYNDFVEGMRPMTEEERESLDEFTWNEMREPKQEIAKGCQHWRCFVEVSDDGSKRSLICPDCNKTIETLEGEAVSQEVLNQIDKSVQNFKEGTLLPIPWELQ